MKLRVYLDTSVVSALFDGRWPERQSATREFWQNARSFELVTSEVAIDELKRTGDVALRERFEEILREICIVSVSDEMTEAAQQYVNEDVFTEPMWNDALHVAAAVVSRCDVLLSWNFRHLVNRRRRARVNDINTTRGLPTIEILAPPEL